MEAHSLQTGIADPARPRAKDGGVAAGIAAIIREVEVLLAGAGGLVVVALGVVAVTTITTASLSTVADGEAATVVTAAFTVVGTIVGAYFGVRVGARGKDEAEAARELATAKVERLAAHLDPHEANQVLDTLDRAAAETALNR